MVQSLKRLIDKYICNPTAYNLHNAQGRGGGRRKGGGLCHSFWYQSRSGQDVETSQLYPFLFRLWHILSYLFTSQVIQKSCLFKSKMISLFKDIRWFIAVINFLCICPKFLQNEYFFFASMCIIHLKICFKFSLLLLILVNDKKETGSVW